MKLRFTLAALAALTLAPAADAGPIRRALARTHHVAANVVAVARHAVHSVAPRAAVAAPAVAPAACTGPNCPAPQFLPVPGSAPMAMAGPGNAAKVVGAQPATAFRPLRIGKRIADFREGVKAELLKRGFDPAEVHLVGQLGDGKILEWIITHGPDIIKFVEMLIALFADGGPSIVPAGTCFTAGCPPSWNLAA